LGAGSSGGCPGVTDCDGAVDTLLTPP